MILRYLIFLGRAFVLSFSGTARFYAWMTFLTIISAIGARLFVVQYVEGLRLTGMTDQISWGVYIANFTFLVGLAASAVMLVIPAYIYRKKELRDVVLYGELLAIAAIVMALLFVMVDLGRPDRLWHMMPFVGELNFPTSILAWDVIVLSGYLLINLHICGYLLYMEYLGKRQLLYVPRVFISTAFFYVPFVFISIVWAIGIHTVTAFLFVGLVGRPFWNTAIVAPRFLGSAFTAGPGILIITFVVLRRIWGIKISDGAIYLLRQIVTASLLINLFLLACESFKEFYAASAHSASAQYLFFGIEHHGQFHGNLAPWIWLAIVMEVLAAVILTVPPTARRMGFLIVACILADTGIWIEKGLGLIIPGFVPTPQGLVLEYAVTWREAVISVSIWAFGLLLFSWMLHLAILILNGEFRLKYEAGRSEPAPHAVPAQ